MKTELLDPRMWESLRKKTVAGRENGFGLCLVVSKELLEVTQSNSEPRAQLVNVTSIPVFAANLSNHAFLKVQLGKITWIADPTAGQICSDFPLGFYGWLAEAPLELRAVYTSTDDQSLTKFRLAYRGQWRRILIGARSYWDRLGLIKQKLREYQSK
jgi:hypothetical protein